MIVQELIDQLSKFDPQTPVIGSTTDPTDYTYKVSIVSIELDNPYDENGFSDVIEWGDNESEDDLYDNNGEYIGPKVVIIDLGLV